MNNGFTNFQTVWGIALVLAGLGVFYRIPQVVREIEAAGYFQSPGFVRFCFYFLGAALVVGGGKKLFHQLRGSNADEPPDPTESGSD
jgi:hypothetical protein